jgi:hypothetical protein
LKTKVAAQFQDIDVRMGALAYNVQGECSSRCWHRWKLVFTFFFFGAGFKAPPPEPLVLHEAVADVSMAEALTIGVGVDIGVTVAPAISVAVELGTGATVVGSAAPVPASPAPAPALAPAPPAAVPAAPVATPDHPAAPKPVSPVKSNGLFGTGASNPFAKKKENKWTKAVKDLRKFEKTKKELEELGEADMTKVMPPAHLTIQARMKIVEEHLHEFPEPQDLLDQLQRLKQLLPLTEMPDLVGQFRACLKMKVQPRLTVSTPTLTLHLPMFCEGCNGRATAGARRPQG